jgi:predicted amidohydrolase
VSPSSRPAPIWHDAAANRALYGALVRALRGQGDLIVLPETFTSGFSNEAIGSAETMQGESVAWLSALAREVGAVVTGSMVIRDGEQVFNRLLWARPDGTLAHYDKRHLFRMANEHHRYADGKRKLLVELNGWRICPLVCYDLRFPVWSRNRHDRAAQRFDYDLLLYVANWPSARRHAWQTLLRARAIENLSYVLGLNRVGVDGNELHYAGDSARTGFPRHATGGTGGAAAVRHRDPLRCGAGSAPPALPGPARCGRIRAAAVKVR